MLARPASVSYSVLPIPAWQLKSKTGSVQALSVTPQVDLHRHGILMPTTLQSPLELSGSLYLLLPPPHLWLGCSGSLSPWEGRWYPRLCANQAQV